MQRWLIAVWAVGCWQCAHNSSVKDHGHASTRHDLGVAQMEQGDLRGALRELLIAEQVDPDMPEVHHSLGLVYHSLAQRDEALAHYEKALDLNPKFSVAYNNYGILLLDLGRHDEAIAAFHKALADILYPTPFLAEGNLGWALYRKGETDSGVTHLKNAVATNPKFCRGYEWLMRIALETNKARDAIGYSHRFERYCLKDNDIVALLPDEYRRQMRYYLGLGHLQEGDRDAAKVAFSQCANDALEGYGQRCSDSLARLR